ncbi:MAG TPA: hypothetical protein VFS00_25840 [Polyangiaceae bacterium]|nr:hypothetical protein [Polyangiaceae bacterium]
MTAVLARALTIALAVALVALAGPPAAANVEGVSGAAETRWGAGVGRAEGPFGVALFSSWRTEGAARAPERGWGWDEADIPRPPSALSAVARVSLYALAAVALLVGALNVGRRSRRDHFEGEGGPPVAISRADALALEGRYEEAVRALFVAALAKVDLCADSALTSTRVSREVLDLSRLEGEVHEALGEFVVAVERTLFGGLAANAADYERCSAAYQNFSAALSRRP